MAKELEPVDFGTVTPVRLVRSVNIQTMWDESLTPPQIRITATYEYEVIYKNAEGEQVVPARYDGQVFLDDEQCRARPEFMTAFEAISGIGDSVKEEPASVVTQTPA